eukprot:5829378-Pyramimonas_sp.AAC.1
MRSAEARVNLRDAHHLEMPDPSCCPDPQGAAARGPAVKPVDRIDDRDDGRDSVLTCEASEGTLASNV